MKGSFISIIFRLIAIGLETLSKQRREEVDRMNKTAGKIKWKVTLSYLSEKLSQSTVKCRNSKAIYERILHYKNSSVMNPIKYWLTYGIAPRIVYKFEPLDLTRTLRENSEMLTNRWKHFLNNMTMEVRLVKFLLFRKKRNVLAP